MTILDQSVLDVLVPGFTHHVDIGQGLDARISYGAGGLAQMVLPGKPPMTGEWTPLAQGLSRRLDGRAAGGLADRA